MKKFFAGVAIALGCWIYLQVPNKIIAAALFSCGLLAVRIYNLELYTGKTQYILTNKYKPHYYLTVLLGNLAGIAFMAMLATPNMAAAARDIALIKSEQSGWIALLNGFACGYLMSLATKPETPLWISSLCVIAFILGGFNHCIADAFYMICGGIYSWTWFMTLIGNTLGGMLMGGL